MTREETEKWAEGGGGWSLDNNLMGKKKPPSAITRDGNVHGLKTQAPLRSPSPLTQKS